MTGQALRWSLSILLSLVGTVGVNAEEVVGPEVCRVQPFQEKIQCYQDYLEGVLQTHGAEQALTELKQTTAQDPDALREAHHLVHHLGQRSFRHYGTAAEALSHCGDLFWSGCSHGVLQAYLSSLVSVEPQHILPLCASSEKVSAYSFERYNCLHGLGHGLIGRFSYDVLKSLVFCDALAGDWERESCYGGVFMENIVTFQNARKAKSASEHHDHAATSFLNAQDLLYPCSVLVEKYLRACYLMQTSAILTFLNYDFAQAFTYCARAHEKHQRTCYQSLGRDISGFSLRDARRVKELCRLGQGDQTRQCFIGAVKDFILTDASPEPGLALCRNLDVSFKHDCYATVGEMVVSLFDDKNRRAQACRQGEDQFVATCLASATAF